MFLSELLQDWPHDLRCVCSFSKLYCLHIPILIQLLQCWHVFVFHLWEVIAVRESPHHNRAPSVDSAFCLSIITPFHIPVIPHGSALPPHPASEPNHSHRRTVVHNFTAHAYFRAHSWTCLLWLTVGHPEVWSWWLCHLHTSQFLSKPHSILSSLFSPPQYAPHPQPPHLSSPQEPSYGVAMCPWLPWWAALIPTKTQNKWVELILVQSLSPSPSLSLSLLGLSSLT